MNPNPGLTAQLVFQSGEVRRAVPIHTLPFTIGRSEECSLVIAHPQVSREHALINMDGASYVLSDQNSRHGTFVNGARVTKRVLRPGDSITLGSRQSVLTFQDGDEGQSQTILAQFSKRWSDSAAESDLGKLSLFLQAAQRLNSIEASQEVLGTMLEYSIQLTGA